LINLTKDEFDEKYTSIKRGDKFKTDIKAQKSQQSFIHLDKYSVSNYLKSKNEP
jgi:hypothetical protein